MATPLNRIALGLLGGTIIALTASAAQAEPELRDFCADRPGLNTPPCTVDAGHFQVEIGLGDWTLDRQPDSRTDTILAGDLLVRYGLDQTTEVEVGWTSFGHVRVRDTATGEVTRTARTGDVLLSVRKSLAGPDGKVAIQPFSASRSRSPSPPKSMLRSTRTVPGAISRSAASSE
jgi:hypothetical protein